MIMEDLAWGIEDACSEAWPALQERTMEGWRLRFSQGVTRRSNSANPLPGTHTISDELIAACETEYNKRELAADFRIPSMMGSEVSKRLDQLGYKIGSESLTFYADVRDAVGYVDAAVTIASKPSEEWFTAMSLLQKHNSEKKLIYRRIVSLVKAPATFAILRDGKLTVSLAYGVFHNGLFCLESVVTDEAMRGHGYAERMLKTLLANAKRASTTGFCLQVRADNAPAIRLYNNLGLRELYRYHYQKKPEL